MNTRSFLQRSFAAVVFALLAVACAETVEAATAMDRILAHHQAGPNDLDVKGLPLDASFKSPEGEAAAAYEIHKVPYPPNYADYFSYRVLLHKATGRYWINISGGIAGQSKFYGPGKVTDLKP